jgi:hypothetical protein
MMIRCEVGGNVTSFSVSDDKISTCRGYYLGASSMTVPGIRLITASFNCFSPLSHAIPTPFRLINLAQNTQTSPTIYRFKIGYKYFRRRIALIVLSFTFAALHSYRFSFDGVEISLDASCSRFLH